MSVPPTTHQRVVFARVPDPGRESLRFEIGVHDYAHLPKASDLRAAAAVATTHPQTLAMPNEIEIIVFGKLHYFPAGSFETEAPRYLRMLGREAALLLDSIASTRSSYLEWADPADSWVANLVADTTAAMVVLRNTLRAVPKTERPDVHRFDVLSAETTAVANRLARSVVDYPTLHEAGVSLHHIRGRLGALIREIEHYRDGAIEAAEVVVRAAETVESTSFQILGLYPTLMGWEPLREAGYKIGLLLVRATARASGAALASSPILPEILGVVKADAPPILVDLITQSVGRYCKQIGVEGIGRDVSLFFIQQHCEFVCDLVLLVASGKPVDADAIGTLAKQRLASVVATVLNRIFAGHPGDAARQKLVKSLLEAMALNLYRSYQDARDRARAANPPRETWEAFLDELPWTLIAVIQGTVTGLMTRNAAKIARDGQARGEDPAEWLENQKASSIFSGETSAPAPAPSRPRLPPMRLDEYRTWSEALNIHPDTAGQLRRCAHDEQIIMAFRLPGVDSKGRRKPGTQMRDLQAELGMRPKPGWIQAKTGPSGVVQLDPASYDRAIQATNEVPEYDEMIRRGVFMRPDGVLFHPGMLVEGAGGPARATAERAVRLLDRVRVLQEGADRNRRRALFNLDHREVRAILASDPEARELIRTALVGYYSDIDLREVVEVRTGQRRSLGRKGDTGSVLDYVRRNQDNLDRAVNVNHDRANLPPGSTPEPHPQNLIQHGGDYEHSEQFGGALGVILPDGHHRVIVSDRHDLPEPDPSMTPGQVRAIERQHVERINDQYEALLRAVLDANYRPLKDRTDVRRPSGPIDWVPPAVPTRHEPVRPAQVAAVRRVPAAQIHDPVIERPPIEANDLIAGLLHRGLTPYVGGSERGAPWEELDRERIGIAWDAEGRNQVLFCRQEAGERLGDCLGRFVRAAIAARIDRPGLRRSWLELYCCLRPVTTCGILSRLAPSDQGLDHLDREAASHLSSADPGRRRHAGWSVDGRQESYTPRRYPTVRGLRLLDVWDDPRTGRRTTHPTLIAGVAIAVFHAPLVGCPAHVDLSWRLLRPSQSRGSVPIA